MLLTYIFTGVVVVISLLVQGHSSFDVLRIGGIKPDLVFICVVYFSYCYGSLYGEVTGFLSGLLTDAVSNSPLGLLAFPKMLLGFLVGKVGRSLIKANALSLALLLFGASIVKGIVTLILCYIFHQAAISDIWGIILPEALYNAAIGTPLFFLFDRIFDTEKSGEGL